MDPVSPTGKNSRLHSFLGDLKKGRARTSSHASSFDSGISVSASSGIKNSVTFEPHLIDAVDLQVFKSLGYCWCTDAFDLVLKIEDFIFPVKKAIVWENSGFFRRICATQSAMMDDDDFNVLKLNGISAYDMEDILPFFYDSFREIPELEVLDLLQTAHMLEAHRVVMKCEEVILNSEDVHPFDLLKIAKKYKLEMLASEAIERLSLIPSVTRYADFDDIDGDSQEKILLGMNWNVKKTHKSSRASILNGPKHIDPIASEVYF